MVVSLLVEEEEAAAATAAVDGSGVDGGLKSRKNGGNGEL